MGFIEISVLVYLAALGLIAFKNSRKVAQELKKS